MLRQLRSIRQHNEKIGNRRLSSAPYLLFCDPHPSLLLNNRLLQELLKSLDDFLTTFTLSHQAFFKSPSAETSRCSNYADPGAGLGDDSLQKRLALLMCKPFFKNRPSNDPFLYSLTNY